MTLTPFHCTLFTAAAALLTFAAGCTAAGPGSELAAASHSDPRALAATGSVPIRLPSAEKFSIRHHEAMRRADLDGRAESAAEVNADGVGAASAAVQNGGAASGLFQVGHSFRNDTQAQMDVEFRIVSTYEYALSNDPQTSAPDAAASLRLHARDSHGRRLRDLTLIDLNTDSGPAKGSDRKDMRITLTLGPNQTANVFLTATASATVTPGRSAEASLRLGELSMELTTRPAPPIKAASDAPAGK